MSAQLTFTDDVRGRCRSADGCSSPRRTPPPVSAKTTVTLRVLLGARAICATDLVFPCRGNGRLKIAAASVALALSSLHMAALGVTLNVYVMSPSVTVSFADGAAA
jgi:hypothetical protein